jgi:uncharacterized protein YraI
MKVPRTLIAAMLLLTPTAAMAARGIVTNSASMRAGPGPGFPVVDRIPGGERVNIHGCLNGVAWCDVSWEGDRGWVSARNLEWFYHDRYVYLPDYVDEIDVPIVPFVLSSYWSSYYAGRPWYHRRAYWNGYWQSHARLATQPLQGRSAGFAAREGRGARAGVVSEGRAANVRGRGEIDRQSVVGRERGDRFSRESFGRERGDRFSGSRQSVVGHERDRFSGARQPFAGREAGQHFSGPRQQTAQPQAGQRFSAAPVNRPAARPDMGRVGAAPGHGGGPAFQSHAQGGGAPRPAMGAMGQMPHAAPAAAPQAHMGGGAPHGGGAPRVGGAPGGAPGGGGPHHPH